MFDFFFSNKNQKKVFDMYDPFEAIEVDIHSHLIPAVDDGSTDVATSVEMVKLMCNLGFKKIITTPHISELYPNDNDSILDGMIRLNKQLKIESIEVELTVAAEYMINDIFEQKLLLNEPLMTLPQKHILIEMSHLSEPVNTYRVLALLKSKGFTPILAHPERYRFYNKNLFQYEKLKTFGCLFQVNILSLLGYYGTSISDCAWSLLNNKLIDLIGSDFHNKRHIEILKNSITPEFQHQINTYPFQNKQLFRSPQKQLK